MGGLLTVLPLAFVMIAGPQIISAVFLATSVEWARNSVAFVLGAAVSITLSVTCAVYRKRNQAKPPKWMGELEQAKPRLSFRLGSCRSACSRPTSSRRSPSGTRLAREGDPGGTRWASSR